MLKLKADLPELYDVLMEMNIDSSAWSVMCALSSENTAMAREFVFFCERILGCGTACTCNIMTCVVHRSCLLFQKQELRKRRETGCVSLAFAFDNPSAVVMKHCQSRYNKVTGSLEFYSVL